MDTALSTAVTLLQSLLDSVVDLFSIPWVMVCGLFIVVGAVINIFLRLTNR